MQCPVQARCGGCPLLTLPLAEQHALKLARVTQGLAAARPAAGMLPAAEMFASHSEGYRRRLRMRLSDDGMLVYFNQDKAVHCLVLAPALRAAITQLREALSALRLDAVALRVVEHLEVRAPDEDDRAGVYLHLRQPQPSLLAALAGQLPRWRIGSQHTQPQSCQRLHLTADSYSYVPIDAFAQVHSATNRLLLDQLIRGARQRGLRTFFDLFAGSGNLSLPLAAAGLVGSAVESQPNAVVALRRAAQAQGLAVTALEADAVDSAARWAAAGEQRDLLLANPPRAGLKRGHAQLASLARRHIALLCCNATAIAQDTAALQQHGFALEQVQCFDMFPHTQHVEVLVWLRRVS